MPLLTIVFTDVVDSSKMKGEVSLGRDSRERDQNYLEKIQASHFRMIRECVKTYHGNEVKTMGDSFFLTFDDPVAAVRCAADIQKRLAAEPIPTPLGPLRVRIGIHSGFPESLEGDYHGTDVDTAARVEATATERQILISSSTYELVRGMTDVKFHFVGEFEPKGVGRQRLWEADWDGKGPRRTSVPPLPAAEPKRKPWAAIGVTVLVLIAALAAIRMYEKAGPAGKHPPAAPKTGRTSVAVLEFKNQGDPSDDWLATTLSGTLTGQLAAGGQLRILSSDDVATMAAGPSLASIVGIGRGVLGMDSASASSDYFVSGSYKVSGDLPARTIHVDLQLQNTETREPIFSASYEGTQSEVSDLGSRIGADLRKRLEIEALTDQEADEVRRITPTDPQAQRLYAEALRKLRTLDAIGARDDLESAIKIEPDYALAHAALAYAWEILGYDHKAEEEAKNAFDHSASLGDPDRELIEARYRTITRNWDRAIEIYRSLWGLRHDEPKYMLEVASVQTDADRGEDALKTLDALRQADKHAGDDPRIDYEEALADEKLSNVKGEQEAAAKAAAKASKQGAQLLAAYAYWQDCEAIFELGDLKAAEGACNSSRQYADSAAGREVQARAESVLGLIKQQQGDPTEALELHKSALSTAEDIGSQKDIVGALLNIADVQSTEGQIDEAEKDLAEAIGIAKKIGDTQQILILQNNYGVDLVTQGKYNDAKEVYEQELTTARNVGNKQAESDALQNLGVAFLQTGDLETAQKDTAKSLDIARKARLKNEELGALSSLGDIQMARGDLHGARDSYNQGLKLSLQAGDEGNAANSRLGLAKLAIEESDAAGSEALAKQAIGAFQKEEDKDSESDARNTLARALIAEGKLTEAQTEVSNAAGTGALNKAVKLSLAITAARLKARMGNAREAEQELTVCLTAAKEMRSAGLQLEVRLAQAEMETSTDVVSAREQLRMIANDAKASGFLLVASRATKMR